MIALLVAHDPNRVIGLNNDLPWRIPEELAYFKKVSMGKALVMGRKTYQSIGRPLPGRLNIVVTRNKAYSEEGVVVVHEIHEAIKEAEKYSDEVIIIGGSEIFNMTIDLADRLYITNIQQHFEGDTYFPAYGDEWELKTSSETIHSKDGIPYSFLVYERDSKG